MFNELAKYAVNNNLACVPGFKSKTAKWVIVLGDNGELIDVVEENQNFPLCPDLQQNELIAGGVTRSHFILDATSTVVGLDADPKELKKHQFFLGLLDEAGKYEAQVKVCHQALSNDETVSEITRILKARKAKKNDSITFRVGNTYPVEKASWHEWWQIFRSSLVSSNNVVPKMICLLDGMEIIPVLTHSKISGLTSVGAQPTGAVLAGFDKEAFASYGLEQSLNAACSEEAVATYRAALNSLISKAPRPLAGTMFLSWFKEVIPDEDNLLDLDALENPIAEAISAREKVNRLMTSINDGTRPDLIDNRYYILAVSGSGGRIMIRDWLEGQFIDLVISFRNWYEDLELTTPDGKGIGQDFKLTAGLMRLVSHRKNENINKTFERINKELSPIMPRLWRSIIMDLPLPDTIASRNLAYIKSKLMNTDDDSSGDNLDRIACAMLKAWLIRHQTYKGGQQMKTEMNPNHSSPAYHAGRLMAVLASLQDSALKDVGAGVVQRYYAAASSTPNLVMGRLVRGAQYHINKLDKGLAKWYEDRIQEIMMCLGDGIPATLDLEGQTLFALGYYQQKATRYPKKNIDSNDLQEEKEEN